MIQEFRPWELFSASPETRRLINEIYDEYWDSFVEDAQEETLRRAMEKAKQSVMNYIPKFLFDLAFFKIMNIYLKLVEK